MSCHASPSLVHTTDGDGQKSGRVGWATRSLVLFSSGCCCVPDVRRIIHQSGRGTIAWLSLTYQWPGAARSFACALNHPFTLGSIHPSETVSGAADELDESSPASSCRAV
ncbi:hypothetical protein OUZ56_005185 [Daphnia magna]|uniref:Uncharacterized protein n=1 Tax=Daphnia magna TaxID=35525 RepID=A0ABQ9YS32_9CRUS|nr:hypothetical protein OUZ56_005185 [Daphnia magna]